MPYTLAFRWSSTERSPSRAAYLAYHGKLTPAKRTARELYHAQKNLFLKHWLEVKDGVSLGTAKRCLSVDLAELQEKEQFDDEEAAHLAGIALVDDRQVQNGN